MKIHGQFYKLRGSNKKYTQLDDLDKLYQELQEICVEDYAKKYGIPANSIMYRVKRYFPADWIAKIVKKRRFHQKKKTQ